ncbi:peptidase M23 [Archangium sp.]|uniref:peptidase M23 n=1 Tax=Archangium sp. TaxID=1872627 RepID=UPI002D4D9CAF|nr:peptidase M23 [Archangium sp.]HYO53686.1 peptidase M23 [Archangium sp.]
MKSGFRRTLSMCGVAMLCISGGAGSAVAATAYGSICDTNARVLCPSGTLAGSLEIGNGTCGSWNYQSMLAGSYYYKYYGGCAGACNGSTCNGGAGNYYIVTGSSGWDFRLLHVYANVSSGSKTCDRCALGLVGGTGSTTTPHTHADNRQYATRHSTWFKGAVSCGSSGYCGNIVGSPTL